MSGPMRNRPRFDLGSRPGFALPLLILLLAFGAIGGIAVSSIAMQQIRSSRDLGSAVRALLAAESGAAAIFNTFVSGGYIMGSGGPFYGDDLEPWGGPALRATPGGDSWRLVSISFPGSEVVVRVEGIAASGTASREVEITFSVSSSMTSAFSTAVVGCSEASLSGSGRIDSYNSSEGPYNQHTANSNGDVAILGGDDGMTPGDLTISGGSPLLGSVRVNGNLTMTSSNTIDGNVEATGDITLRGGGANIMGDLRGNGKVDLRNTDNIHGSLFAKGDVTFHNGAKVFGDLHTEGNLTINNTGARINGIARARGNLSLVNIPCNSSEIRYGGSIVKDPGSWWCNGAGQRDFLVKDTGIGNVPPVVPPSGTCDPLDVTTFVDQQIAEAAAAGTPQSGNLSQWSPTPHDFYSNPSFTSSFNPGSNKVNFHTGSVDQIYVDGDFKVAGSSEIRFTRPLPGQNNRVKLFITGDFDMGGGAKFIIEPGVAVEVYVQGKTNLGGGLVNENSTPTITTTNAAGETEVKPSFVIYSSSSSNDGVKISGSAQIYASVYAPKARVEVVGSGGLYGSVRGREVNVKGNGGIHYDELLSQTQDISTPGGGNPMISKWRDIL